MNLRLVSIEDIALMKIIAIGNRGVKKDFCDMFFILKKYYSISNIFDLFPKKFGTDTFSQFHYLKSLTYFESEDNDESVVNLVSENVEWEVIKDFLKKEIKKYNFSN